MTSQQRISHLVGVPEKEREQQSRSRQQTRPGSYQREALIGFGLHACQAWILSSLVRADAPIRLLVIFDAQLNATVREVVDNVIIERNASLVETELSWRWPQYRRPSKDRVSEP